MKIEADEVDETVVALDTYNSDLNLVIAASRYAAHPLTNEGFAFMWAGARATHGCKKGKICYEVKIVEYLDVSHLPADEPNPHVVRVGFSVESSTLQLGEDPLSYGYGGTGKISTNCQFKDFGGSFGAGDVILALLNMDSDQIQIGFAKNGKFLGWAYRVNRNELKGQALFPHILTKNVSFEVNFGQKEKPYFPSPEAAKDFTFVNCAPVENRVSGTRAPKRKEDCEMIMMCGIPGAGKSVWAAEYSAKHPEKKYNILGTNNIIDKMKVMGLPRKRNYAGRWDVLIQMATKCLNKCFEIGSKLRRNYILDQTNVYPTAQRRKMKNFQSFKRIAVVVVPTEEEYKRRCDKRDREEGKEVPDSAVNEMKANFKIPEENDIFNEIIFTELQRPEAEKLVRMYNEDGKAATGPPRKQFRGNQGFDSNRGGFNSNQSGSPGRGGFSNRGGYDGNRAGYDSRGGYGGSDHGSFNDSRGGYGGGNRGSFDNRGYGGEGRGSFEDSRGGYGGGGRSSFEDNRGGHRGGGRGSFDNNRGGYGGGGRSSYDDNQGGYGGGRGSFDDNRGGYGGGGRGSYEGGRGGFDKSSYGNSRGGYQSQGGRYDDSRGRNRDTDNGRFDQPQRGGGSPAGYGGNAQSSYSGYGEDSENNRGYGSYRGRGRGDFRGARSSGGQGGYGNFSQDNSRDQYSGDSYKSSPERRYDKDGSSMGRGQRGYQGGQPRGMSRGGTPRGGSNPRGGYSQSGFNNNNNSSSSWNSSSSYGGSFGGYQDDNSQSQSGYRTSYDAYPKREPEPYAALPQSGFKKEPGTETVNYEGGSRLPRGASRPSGRTTTRWSAEQPQRSTPTQDDTTRWSAEQPQRTTPTQDDTYSQYGAQVKAEPPSNTGANRYNYSGQATNSYSTQASNYSGYTQNTQTTSGYPPTQSYGYQQSSTSTVAPQSWNTPQNTASVNTPAAPGAADQSQWGQYYQQPQTQQTQYYNQYYGQPATGTAPSYGSAYGK